MNGRPLRLRFQRFVKRRRMKHWERISRAHDKASGRVGGATGRRGHNMCDELARLADFFERLLCHAQR